MKHWTRLYFTGPIPKERRKFSATYTNGNIYIFGGEDTTFTCLNDLYKFTIHSKQWTRIQTSGKAPRRCLHSMVYYDNQLIVYGGCMEDKISDSRKSLSVLNLLSNEWSSPNTTGETIEHRYSHSAVVYNGKMVIFGGRNNRSFFGDLCLLDLKTYKWRIQEDASGIYPTPRAKHSAVVHEQMMYIYGGWYNKRLGDLYAYNFLTSHWTKIVHHKGTIPSPRYAHHAVMKANGFMFIFGGFDGNFCHDMYLLNTATMEWNRVDSYGEIPDQELLHTVVADENGMYVFGRFNVKNERMSCHVFNFHVPINDQRMLAILKSGTFGDCQIICKSEY